MKQTLKAYIVLLTVIFIATYIISEHYAKKVDNEVYIYNQRIAILYNAHEVLYHLTAIQKDLYSYTQNGPSESLDINFLELEKGIANLSRGVSYIFYLGRDNKLFRTYSHHVEVIETLYPAFADKVKAVLSVEAGHVRERYLREAIETSEGIELFIEELDKFLSIEYDDISRSLPTVTAKMRQVRNISGLLLFLVIAISSIAMFRTCKSFRGILPFIRAVKGGDFNFKPDTNNDVCTREIISAFNAIKDKIDEGMEISESLTITDPLTGAYNRRYFDIRIAEEMNRCIRYGTIFSLSILDIDHFKKINDTMGHQTGDLVLKEVVMLIKENVRDTDIVTRYGGEEFAIIYPCTPKSGVLTHVERLRYMVESYKFTNLDRPLTISIGAADSAGKSTAEKIIQEADSSLYTAKNMGRNRCIIVGVTT